MNIGPLAACLGRAISVRLGPADRQRGRLIIERQDEVVPEGPRIPIGLLIGANLAGPREAALRLKGLGLLQPIARNMDRPPYPASPISTATTVSVLACQILGQGLFATSQAMTASTALVVKTARAGPATRLIEA